MAKRTYRRGVSYDGITSAQLSKLQGSNFNFMKFSGINSNRNYVTIDQQSFAEATNVYIDDDERLHMRPVTKLYEKGPDEKVIRIRKINNVVFYLVKTEQDEEVTYSLKFYTTSWQEIPFSLFARLYWFDDKYVVFDTNSLYGFSINEDGTLTEYTAEELVYIPNYVVDIDSFTGETDKNILTDATAKMLVYSPEQLDTGNFPNSNAFIGLKVLVNMDGDNYTVVWDKNNEVTFAYKLGEISAEHVQFSKSGKYAIAYNDNDTVFYYSEDGGQSFIPINNPNGTTSEVKYYANNRTICISEDEDCIMYVLGVTTDYNSTSRFFHFCDIPIASPTNVSWSTDTYNSTYYKANLKLSALGGYDYGYANALFSPMVFGDQGLISHCINRSNYVIADASGNQYYLTTYQNNSSVWSINQSDQRQVNFDGPCPIEMIAKMNGKFSSVVSYAETNTDDLYTARITSNCKIKMIQNDGYYIIAIGAFVREYVGTNDPWLPWVTYGITKPSQSHKTYVSDFYPAFRMLNDCIASYFFNLARVRTTSNKNYNFDNWCDFIASIVTKYGDNQKDYAATYDAVNGNGVFDHATTYDIRVNGNLADHDCTVNITSITAKKRMTTYYELVPINSTPLPYEPYKDGKRSINSAYFNAAKTVKLFPNGTGLLLNTALVTDDQAWGLITDRDNTIALFANSESNFIYKTNDTLFANGMRGNVTVTYTPEQIEFNYLVPSFVEEFVTHSNTVTVGSELYQTVYRDGKLYIPKSSKVTFEGEITNVARFSQTSLGIFLENNVYEYSYNSSLTNSLEVNSFQKYSTKLQLGCLKGSDIIYNYDGQSIFMTNLKGLVALTYQDFVQSTEQVFNYLTSNVTDDYRHWSENYKEPIKLYQYKNWLFLYKTNNKVMFVFDTRNASWWKWEFATPCKQIIYNNDELLILFEDTLCYLDFYDNKSVFDNDTEFVNWKVKSQPIHFGCVWRYYARNRFS